MNQDIPRERVLSRNATLFAMAFVVLSTLTMACRDCRPSASGSPALTPRATLSAGSDTIVVGIWFAQFEHLFDRGTGRTSVYGFLAEVERKDFRDHEPMQWGTSSRIVGLFRSRREALVRCQERGIDQSEIPWCRLTHDNKGWTFQAQPFPAGNDLEQGMRDGPDIAIETRGFGPVMTLYMLPDFDDGVHVFVAASCGYGMAMQTLASTDSFTSLVVGTRTAREMVRDLNVQKLDWSCFEVVGNKLVGSNDPDRCP